MKAPSNPMSKPTPGMTRNHRSEIVSSEPTWLPSGSSCCAMPRLNPSWFCQSTSAPASQLTSAPRIVPANRPKTNPVIAPANMALRIDSRTR